MFSQNKGTIDNKKNRKLRELIRRRKRKKLEVIEHETKEKEIIEKKKKEDVIISSNLKQENKKVDIDTDDDIKIEVIRKKGKKEEENINKTKSTPPIVPNESKKEELIVEIIKDETKKDVKETPNDVLEKSPKKENMEETTTSYRKRHGDQEKEYAENNKINETQEENLLELALTNELEVILKEHQYDLNKLIVEFNIINKQVDEKVETKEIEKMSEYIDDLVIKLEIIKKELELLTNSATFKNIYKLHDPYLTNLIDEYKDTLTQSSELIDTVEQVEKDDLYISLINKIIEFENEKEKLSNKLSETREKYQIRDENFEKWKDDYTDIEKITKSLDELVYISELRLKEIEDKVSEAVHITEVVETRMKSSLGILAKTMLIMALLKKNPTRKANGLTAITALTAFSLVNDLIKPKKVTTKHLITDLVDYRNMISNAINDVESINSLINKGLSEVESLKRTFEEEFREYQYDFPEYKEFIDKLNSIEKEMFDRQNNMKKISSELSLQYDKNNAKVKKYGNYS